MVVRHDTLAVEWLGYATARIEATDGTVVYTDPGRYGVLDGMAPKDGHLVLVTHDHHYDSDGIERVARDDAIVVVHDAIDPKDINRPVAPLVALPYQVRRVAIGDAIDLLEGRVRVEVTPAHNTNGNASISHPPGHGCGFRFEIGGRWVFWPGDSDVLPEFADLEVSLLLANIGGSVVMDRHDAAVLAETLDPDLVIPIHYDTIDLLEADARAFAADVAARSIPVALDE